MGRLWYIPFKNHVDPVSMNRNWTHIEDFINNLELKEVGPVGGGVKTYSAGAPSASDGDDGDWQYTDAAIFVKQSGSWVNMFTRYTDVEAAAKIAADDLYVPRTEYGQSPFSGVWGFDTAVTATPAAGDLGFDNVTAGSVTNVYVNQTDDGANDRTILTGLVANTDTILIAAATDPGRVILFTVSGAPSLSAGVVTIPVTYQDHDGTVPWTLGDRVVFGLR